MAAAAAVAAAGAAWKAAFLASSSSSSSLFWSSCRTPHVSRGVVSQKLEARGRDDASKTTPSLRAVPTASVPVSSRVQTPGRKLPTPRQVPETIPATDGGRMWELVETVRSMLNSLHDGEISVSAYDTAWVARVPALDGSNKPQFPMCLNWIMNNQLEDGSWGDRDLFLTYDRICSALACAIALKTWNTGDKIVHKALEFIRKTMPKMELEDSTHMPIGFEIVFPAMIEEAMALELDIDYREPVLQTIYAERKKKLERIPMNVVQNYPTTLLHSLEGLHKTIDWDKVIKLQSPDGSLLFSPASTACALMHTGNEKCLQYLNNLVKRFNCAVPNVYPVDLFEHLWIVDRLQRLGISRYFTQEIKSALDYVYRYWTDKGIAWARGSPVQDADDTSMAFRLLRSHGYDISPDAFKTFQEGDSFVCFSGQAGQAVTGMYNLYRASQVMFPGETILEEAGSFARKFLEGKRQENQLYDKWIISKDLPGEVEFALDNPMHARLERLATRRYIDQYAADDVWIGKSLYRMPFVNNPIFLELAKADFNMCRALHRKEFQQLERWYDESSLSMFKGFSRSKLEQTFYSAAATIFEPELSPARLIWSQCWFISLGINEYFDHQGSTKELEDLINNVERWNVNSLGNCSAEVKILFVELYNIVQNHSKQGFLYQGRSIGGALREIWKTWLSSLLQRTKWKMSDNNPTLEEYLKASHSSIEPAVRSTMYFVGETLATTGDIKDSAICQMMNTASRLVQDTHTDKVDSSLNSITIYLEENPQLTKSEALSEVQALANKNMQKLLYETLQPGALPQACKQLFLNAARIMNVFPGTNKVQAKLSNHVKRVLSQPVL
ncbi:copalyl diphosphate synthase 2 [Selaginella moellendorffii]|nr:copalyl diphosphate synthase 2 [Selaginella moellendorffii]|eukprot:XP_024527840.1 copalyl diphosphate synthase 2 [Selaginella moellendorffii]